MARIAKKKTVDNNAGLLKVVDGINKKDVESVTDFGHFFFPINFGNIPCSLAIEAINDGVLNEAEKATPKILTSIPKIIKAYPHLPIVVPSPFARAPPKALASGVE